MSDHVRLVGRLAPRRLALAAVLLLAAARASAVEPLCVADTHTLCLNDGRFSVTAFYQQTPEGPSFDGTAVPLTDDSGYFWFFNSSNVEVTVKVLNGCGLEPGAYWFFAAGLTNVGVAILVKDEKTGVVRMYSNLIGTPFAPIQDTDAFSSCP
jgi:hypothetical protein